MKKHYQEPKWLADAAAEYAERFKIPEIRRSERDKLHRLLRRHWLKRIREKDLMIKASLSAKE